MSNKPIDPRLQLPPGYARKVNQDIERLDPDYGRRVNQDIERLRVAGPPEGKPPDNLPPTSQPLANSQLSMSLLNTGPQQELVAAVAERLEKHRPGARGNEQWKPFCDKVRKACGKTASDRGYSDSTIKRIVRQSKQAK